MLKGYFGRNKLTAQAFQVEKNICFDRTNISVPSRGRFTEYGSQHYCSILDHNTIAQFWIYPIVMRCSCMKNTQLRLKHGLLVATLKTHPTSGRPHQFRELGITEGPPSIFQKFSAKKWTFHVQGQPMCLTTHENPPPNVRKAVVNEFEFLLRCALFRTAPYSRILCSLHFYVEIKLSEKLDK